jgi:hypothetical protein
LPSSTTPDTATAIVVDVDVAVVDGDVVCGDVVGAVVAASIAGSVGVGGAVGVGVGVAVGAGVGVAVGVAVGVGVGVGVGVVPPSICSTVTTASSLAVTGSSPCGG